MMTRVVRTHSTRCFGSDRMSDWRREKAAAKSIVKSGITIIAAILGIGIFGS